MNTQEMTGLLDYIVKYPYDSQDAIDKLFDEWSGLKSLIKELSAAFDYVEREKEAFRKKCAELGEQVERLQSEKRHYEKAEPLNEAEQSLAKYLREKRDEGKIVFYVVGDLMESTPERICNQSADGLLWDLNRDEMTCVTFAHEDPTWVNNFATAQVIRFLHQEYMKEKS